MPEVRIQKFLSESGIASRRKAESFIVSGQVLVNGKKAKPCDKMEKG
jgi:16S rRNA U516 pseudouridylate synthase RsuA-like enzyme